jgi:predicted RNase H-like HicB family nuclease
MHVCGYHIIFEPGPTGYAAYAPRLPGLGVAGGTLAETMRLIREAVPFHLEGLRAEGMPIPISDEDLDDIAAAEEARAEGGRRPYAEVRRELGLEQEGGR